MSWQQQEANTHSHGRRGVVNSMALPAPREHSGGAGFLGSVRSQAAGSQLQCAEPVRPRECGLGRDSVCQVHSHPKRIYLVAFLQRHLGSGVYGKIKFSRYRIDSNVLEETLHTHIDTPPS